MISLAGVVRSSSGGLYAQAMNISKPKTATMHHRLKKKKRGYGSKVLSKRFWAVCKYDTALKNGDKSGLFAELEKINLAQGESIYPDALGARNSGNFANTLYRLEQKMV